MIRASIDIGSNSLLLLIGEVSESGDVKDYANESRVTGLGKGIDTTKEFSHESIADTMKALGEFRDILRKYDIAADKVIVTATEASRVALNARPFFSRIKSELGFDVNIISSQGEAYYTALGVCSGLKSSKQKHIPIMDIGGASTEFVLVRTSDGKVLETVSLPVGSVRANDWISQKTFAAKVSSLVDNYEISKFKTKELVCVAGSMTSLAVMIKGETSFEERKIDGLTIDVKDFCQFIDKIDELEPDQLETEYPFLGKRSQTILAGARLARILIDSVDAEVLMISTRGLRYGVLIEGGVNERYIENKL